MKKHSIILCVLLSVAAIIVFCGLKSICATGDTRKPQQKQTETSIQIDVTQFSDWLQVAHEIYRLSPYGASEIVLYQPSGNEYCKFTNRSNHYHYPDTEQKRKYIILNFCRDGIRVHEADDYYSRFSIGQHPHMLHLYQSANEPDSFVTWHDFPQFLKKISRRNTGWRYYMTINMDNQCTIAELFPRYKLLSEIFPEEWYLEIKCWPGAYFPFNGQPEPDSEKKTDNDIDALVQSIIGILQAKDNHEAHAQKYVELCTRLAQLSQSRSVDVKASLLKYGMQLSRAYFNTSNQLILDINEH